MQAREDHGDTGLPHPYPWYLSIRFGLDAAGPCRFPNLRLHFLQVQTTMRTHVPSSFPACDLMYPKSQLFMSHETEMFIGDCYVHLGSILR